MVQFSSPTVDSAANTITSWNWDFGDGSFSTNQSPFHTYATAGRFVICLVATNEVGINVIGVGPSIDVQFNPGLVVNGDFGTGDFTGWDLGGTNGISSIADVVDYQARFATEHFINLYQGLNTSPNTTYVLSFSVSFYTYNATAHFLVSWDDVAVFDTASACGWTNMQFLVSARSSYTTLMFSFSDSLGLSDFSLSYISVTTYGPTIAFSASPTNGLVPLAVQFASPTTDAYGNTITNWSWTFGDGSTSTAQNPIHTYTTAGTWHTALVATNGLGVVLLGSGPAITTFASPLTAGFMFTTNNGAISITGYTGSGGAVAIPDWVNGLPVTSIGPNAFFNCTNLTSVTIPNNVTNIGYGAFSWCSSLTNVTLGNSVTSIGGQAFMFCTTLANVAIPESVTSIEDYAFQHTALTSVTIPDNVTNIGYGVFSWCPSLTNVTLGNSVTRIGKWSFKNALQQPHRDNGGCN